MSGLPDPVAAARAPAAGQPGDRARARCQTARRALARDLARADHGLILLIADDPALARASAPRPASAGKARARGGALARASPGWIITAGGAFAGRGLRIAYADAVFLSPVFRHQQPSGRTIPDARRARG